MEAEDDDDEDEGGTPDDVFLTAAVASVAPPSVAATDPVGARDVDDRRDSTDDGGRVRRRRRGRRVAIELRLQTPRAAAALGAKPEGWTTKAKGERARTKTRLASTFGRDAPAARARAGARVRSTTSAGYRAPEPKAPGEEPGPHQPKGKRTPRGRRRRRTGTGSRAGAQRRPNDPRRRRTTRGGTLGTLGTPHPNRTPAPAVRDARQAETPEGRGRRATGARADQRGGQEQAATQQAIEPERRRGRRRLHREGFGRRRRLGLGGLGGFRFGPLAPYVGVGEARAESRSLRGGTRG